MFRGKLLGLGTVLFLAVGGSLMAEAAQVPESQPQSYVGDSRFISKFTGRDFIPDDNLRKPAWRRATWVKVDHDAFSPATFPQSTTEIASLWTPDYVYFAFRCQYTTLNVFEGGDPGKDYWGLWTRDVVEIFLNPHPEHLNQYYEFEVAPNNLWVDLAIDLDKKPMNDVTWNSGIEPATHIDAKKHVWTCELRIPVAAVNEARPLVPNAEWRINLYRIDGPGPDAQRRFLSWNPVHGKHSFHTPASFGLLRFEM